LEKLNLINLCNKTTNKECLFMSKVYFADIRARNEKNSKIEKIKNLFEKAGFGDLIEDGDFTAIKLHFGEYGNDGYINPVFARQVVDKIKEHKGKPFVTDTNTLYSGMRHNSIDHLRVANLHGFNFSVLDAPVIIADGLKRKNYSEIDIEGKHFKKVKIASDIINSDGMIVMSHLKVMGWPDLVVLLKILLWVVLPLPEKKNNMMLK